MLNQSDTQLAGISGDVVLILSQNGVLVCEIGRDQDSLSYPEGPWFAMVYIARIQAPLSNPMKKVPAPKFTEPPLEPFEKDEIERLLKVCDYCDEANTNDRRKFTMRRPTARRDRAIVLTLLDTGLRATELCSLLIGNVDLNIGKVSVMHGVRGGAKGGKGRMVFLGKATRSAVWHYLVQREDRSDQNAPLFLGKDNRPMTQDGLRHLIKRIADRAKVENAYPHKFRHTFALTYLRSGGDVFTLQALLGHTSLDMVRHYARIAEIDIEQAHRRASPVDNWRL
jgi:integrase/recombinase XerD